MPVAVVLADLHIGHPAAIWPLTHITKEGNKITCNAAQRKLLEYWRDFWTLPEAQEADYVINLAESIEGYSPREHGDHSGIMTPQLNEQMRAFLALIEPHIAGKRYLCVEGSKYHGSQDVRVERVICQEVEKRGAARAHYFGYIGNWRPEGTEQSVFLTHKIAGGMLYKAGPLDRWSLFISSVQHKTGANPGLVLSAHDHQLFITSTAHRIMVKAPCFKFWNPIKDASRWPFSQPTIGALIIKIPHKGRCIIEPHTYRLERIYDAMCEV